VEIPSDVKDESIKLITSHIIPAPKGTELKMVSSQTTNARDKKQAEQKRLIQEIESQIGSKGDHPEDELILDTRYSTDVDRQDERLTRSPEDLVSHLKARKDGWTCREVMEAYVRPISRMRWLMIDKSSMRYSSQDKLLN
jgi:hypothetical protein